MAVFPYQKIEALSLTHKTRSEHLYQQVPETP